MTYAESMKIAINAPCVETIQSRSGCEVLRAPEVTCEWDCEHCGWNPREKQRRLKTGTFKSGKLIFKKRRFENHV